MKEANESALKYHNLVHSYWGRQGRRTVLVHVYSGFLRLHTRAIAMAAADSDLVIFTPFEVI